MLLLCITLAFLGGRRCLICRLCASRVVLSAAVVVSSLPTGQILGSVPEPKP